MIHKIWLRKWKAYDSLELDFVEGTTFLIAENGIGKSSIIQALYFALFGSQNLLGTDLPITSAVRGANGDIGIVGCEISLGSRSVRLERSVEKSSRTSEVNSTIDIDGQRASENKWLELIHATTGVDAAQLALLAFVYEGATISVEDAGPSTVEMLAEVFGIDRLRRAARQCETVAKRLDRDNDNLRKALRDGPLRKDTQRAANLEAEAAQMTARLEVLRDRQNILDHYEELQREWASYETSMLRFRHAITTDQEHTSKLIVKIYELIPESFDAEILEDGRVGVERATAFLVQRYEQLLAERGRLEATRLAAEQHIASLSAVTPVCPTCRQPLSAYAAKRALKEHDVTVRRSEAELLSTGGDLVIIRNLIDEARGFFSSPRPTAPVPPVEILPEADIAVDKPSLQSEISQLMLAISNNQAELMAIRRIDEERKQNALLSARLLEGYRAVERSQLAASTMTKLADAICADRIVPMTNEIQKRWPALSSDSQLHMGPSGALSLEEGNHIVSYGGLSGGQRTLAMLTLRLLALQMATRCSFFVLDEPLEHLDSRNRRSLASLLVQATRESPQLRQVLVTTYEESVTRRLSSIPANGNDGKDSYSSPGAHIVRISANRKRATS